MRKLDRGCAWLIGCLLLVIAHAALALPPPPQSWQHDIDRLVADDSARPSPRHGVLFVGSSSIRMWTMLTADFPGVPVIDHGFGVIATARSTVAPGIQPEDGGYDTAPTDEPMPTAAK